VHSGPPLPALPVARLWCAITRPGCCPYSGKCTLKAAEGLNHLALYG
jgi:hypothetical protein